MRGGVSSATSSSINTKAGIGVERMHQVSKNPVQSLMSPAPFRAPLRAGAYSGRMTEGLQRRGLLSR